MELNLPIILVDLFRLSVWLLIIVAIFLPLEKLYPLHKQRFFRQDFAVDLYYFFLSGLAPKILLIVPMSLTAMLLHDYMPLELHRQLAELPFLARFFAAMIVGEIGTYWGHRWMHENAYLWRFHAIHHSAPHIDWLVNTRAHPIDLVFPRFCGLLPMYFLGLAQPMANQMDIVPMLIMLVGTLWGFFIHSNLRWRFGYFEWLLSTPAFHHWHHTNDSHAVINKNYAPLLPWVDKLFGTFYLPKQWPVKYGIDGPVPVNLMAQLLLPFLPKKKSTNSKSP